MAVLPHHGGSRLRSADERSDVGGYGAEGVAPSPWVTT